MYEWLYKYSGVATHKCALYTSPSYYEHTQSWLMAACVLPSTQRALIYFVYFVILVLNHPSDSFVNLVLRHIRTSLALSMFGDSVNCQPGDLHQETVRAHPGI
jgi:hypothetical protein